MMEPPTLQQIQARPDISELSGLLRNLLEVGEALPPNTPATALKVLWHLLDPVQKGIQPPRNMQQWFSSLQEWKAGVAQLDMPQEYYFPYPFKASLDWMTELYLVSPAICIEHCNDVRRMLEYSKPASALHADPVHGLHRWSDAKSADVWPAGSLDSVPAGCKVNDVSGGDKPANLEHGQVHNWRQLLPAPLRVLTLPWWSPSASSGVILAGGAVACLVTPGTTPSDYDLFLVVPSGAGRSIEQRLAEARRLVIDTINALLSADYGQEQGRVHSWAFFTGDVVNLYLAKSAVTSLEELTEGSDKVLFKAQIIMRVYESPAEVVHSFDLDACSLLFNGSEVWATERALRAFHTGMTLADPFQQSFMASRYVSRLIKYSRRFGLTIIIPGMHEVWRQAMINHLDLVMEGLREQLDEHVGIQVTYMEPLTGQQIDEELDEDVSRTDAEFTKQDLMLWRGLKDILRVAPVKYYFAGSVHPRFNEVLPEDNLSEEREFTGLPRQGVLANRWDVDNLLNGDCHFQLRSERHGRLAPGSFAGDPVQEWYRAGVAVLEQLNRQGTSPREEAMRMMHIDMP